MFFDFVFDQLGFDVLYRFGFCGAAVAVTVVIGSV